MTYLLTLGEIARRIGVPRTRLDYALDKAGIKERGRAGILRLFSVDQVPVIEAALSTVRVRHGSGRKGAAKRAQRVKDGDDVPHNCGLSQETATPPVARRRGCEEKVLTPNHITRSAFGQVPAFLARFSEHGRQLVRAAFERAVRCKPGSRRPSRSAEANSGANETRHRANAGLPARQSWKRTKAEADGR